MCFAQVGQDNPGSPDIERCHRGQLLCLCRSAPLVDAFTSCAGQTCPEFAAQVNGTAICQSSETGALDPSDSGDIGPSDTASGAGAYPSSTAGGVDAGPASDTASGAGASNTANGAGAENTESGAPAPAPTSGGADAGNGLRSHGVAMLNVVVCGAAVILTSGLQLPM